MTQGLIPAPKQTTSDTGELPKSLTRPDVGAAMQPVEGENELATDLESLPKEPELHCGLCGLHHTACEFAMYFPAYR